jgi:DNA-binding transcriptional regulator LsrR (DeoR family)
MKFCSLILQQIDEQNFTFEKYFTRIIVARQPQPVDLRLLSRVSKLYYEQNLNQAEIAEKLHLSRPKVSRLLQQALDEGVVQINVSLPPGVYTVLEERLEERFGLKEVVISDVIDPDSQIAVSRDLGFAAANYFQRTVRNGDLIGISWGTTLSAMVKALQPMNPHGTRVVQLIGGLGMPNAETHATSLCQRLTQLLGSELTLLHAPGIVDNQMIKKAILSDSHMQKVMDLFSKINVAYVGIGVPTPESVVMRDGTIMSQADLENLFSLGAVGDIALRFFDKNGIPIQSELGERVIGITLEQLRQLPRVVGVAGGPKKRSVVHAALEGRLIDVLITDNQTAQELLR